MGNSASCITRSTRPLTAKLMDSDGHLHRVELPTSVAELMIEFPSHVVSRAEDLAQTRRVKGMQADEQLRPDEVYLLLRRNRVGSRIDDQQREVIERVMSCGGMKKRMLDCGLGGKVVPDKEEEGEDTGCSDQKAGGYRRQWRPLLDTIIECN